MGFSNERMRTGQLVNWFLLDGLELTPAGYPVTQALSLPFGVDHLIGFNELLTCKHPENAGVHFFLDDYQFERFWRMPERYLYALEKCPLVIGPDFSLYTDFPAPIQHWNHYRNQFRQFLLQAYSRAFEACRTGASAYIFHADTEGEAFRAMFREAGWGLHGCLVWVKNSLVLGHSDYQWQHEPCLYGWKPGANHYFVNDRSQTTVIDDAKPDDLRHMKKDQLLEWAIKAQELLTQKPSSVIRCDKPPRNAEHPTMKPVVLCGRLIKNSSLPGQTVLDLFGGSGSTLIACEQLSRKCYTMEYDPRYVDVIVQRWEDFTGEKAVRLK